MAFLKANKNRASRKNKSASKHKKNKNKNMKRFHFQSATGETVHVHSGGPCVFPPEVCHAPIPSKSQAFFSFFFVLFCFCQ